MPEIQELITSMKTELVGQIGGFKTELGNMQKQLDAIDQQMQRPRYGDGGSSLVGELKRNTDLEGMIKRGRGSVQFELSGKNLSELLNQKNISTAGVGGFGTPGPMPYDRDSAIVGMARHRLRMRDVLPSRQTSQGEVMWVTETARPTKASPVTEYTGLKPLAEASFEVNKEPIQTIALTFKASKQVLADWPELEAFLRNEFASRVREEEDAQILLGSGTPPNLNGLIPQAQPWDISLLTASDGYEYPDIIRGALQQIAEADELSGAQFAVLHSGDAWKIRGLKDSTGRYIFPATGPLDFWGALAVETNQITKGTFLVGSGDPMAVEIRDREALTVELSTEDGDNFPYNLVTVRAELRTALVVKRPDAFVYGNLTQSPA